MLERVGYYAYLFPTYKQGKKILWNGMDREGFKFTDHFPKSLRKRTDNTEMLIELKNGSIFQVIGTDNYDSLRGANVVGCVFSEFAWQNPMAWDVIRPILSENDGWAVFNSTPLGKNHLYRLFNYAKKEEGWFTQLLTVDDTRREDGSPLITGQMIESELRELQARGEIEDAAAFIQQEYYCSFSAAIPGSYYTQQLQAAREQDRIGKYIYDKDLLTHTASDLGIDDATSTIFYQKLRNEIRIFDYEEHNGESLQFYSSLWESKGYRYGTMYLPHDAGAKNRQTGKTDKEILEDLGWHNCEIVPISDVQTGIQTVRMLFPQIYICERGIDETHTKRLEMFIDRISQYHKEYDEDRKIFRSKPDHDFNSHAADALRTLATGLPREETIVDDSPYLHDQVGRLG